MIQINEPKLQKICAEEATSRDLSADFQSLLDEIGDAADSTVKAAMLAIALFQQVKRALQFKQNGARALLPSESVERAFNRYLTE